jgi:glutaredoxin
MFDRLRDVWKSNPSTYTAPPGIPSPDEPRKLVLYKSDACIFCIYVMRAIDKLGLELQYRDAWGDPDAGTFLREQTGRSTVPCLFIDDVPLFESKDIGRWLHAYSERVAT